MLVASTSAGSIAVGTQSFFDDETTLAVTLVRALKVDERAHQHCRTYLSIFIYLLFCHSKITIQCCCGHIMLHNTLNIN